MERKVNRNRTTGHRIVEADEGSEYDSIMSSNTDEEGDSFVKQKKAAVPFDEEDEENDRSDDEIDVNKLDVEDRALLARFNALKKYLPKYQVKEKAEKQEGVSPNNTQNSPRGQGTATLAMENTSPDAKRIQRGQ